LRVRYLLIALLLFAGAVPDRSASAAPLERGTAIVDPAALRELDRGKFGIGRMLLPERSANIPLTDSELFALPSMLPVRQAVDGEFERYVARHQKSLPNETIGVGDGFAFQLFDRALLDSPETRFVLAGIVNRMDRAYVSQADCGEIRLIYRLTRINVPDSEDNTASPRLPMTLNLVLKARVEGQPIACSEIARRWLAAGDLVLMGTELRTDYLLKVFRYDPQAHLFQEAPMENQIDRDRILADDGLKREFKTWLLDPGHFVEFDRGTALIPEKFLARGAIAPTPVGFDPSDLQSEFGLLQGEGATANPVFTEADIVAALRKASADGMTLQNIRSVGGFERRLNDVTCSGCHQTRGIGGFHFPGVDWMTATPSNSTVVPASPHFFGDQVRRRDILTALRDGRSPDYSRGFSSRPQSRGSMELASTEYGDGWGAHCYVRSPKTADNDRSFNSWGCAEGLACQPTGKTSRMGMCFVKSR